MVNRTIVLCFMALFYLGMAFADENICLFTSGNNEKINITLNDDGIISSIEGTMSDLFFVPTKITNNGNETLIAIKYSGDGCFVKKILRKDNFVEIENLIKNTQEIVINKVNFENRLPYDDYVKIRETNFGYISEFTDSSYSMLPFIENENGIVYEHYVNMKNRNFKYEYNDGTVHISKIIPGNNWQKFLSVKYADLRSKDLLVNLTNYFIIYSYNDIIGTMMFPVLFDLQNTSQYLECTYRADNFLTEGNVKYIPENLGTNEVSKPWVEGLAGDGIGSRIFISTKNGDEISVLEFSNGFVSLKKQTYFNNNRVKKILITGENKSQRQEVLIPDSSDAFEIKLNFSSKLITIELLEVYKGEKYQDTCINYILCK